MPRRAKGPRLWLRSARRDAAGNITHQPRFFILDRGRQRGTGFDTVEQAEQALADYIRKKRRQAADAGPRDLAAIPMGDVIRLYATDVVAVQPSETLRKAAGHRLKRITAFFGRYTLADINGPLCRSYARQSSTDAMARRDLEDLRAAIIHHRKEGLHDRIVSVVLPDRRPARERWLDRNEAARLLWGAWRRPKCKQIAKFILVALYTGRRASVVCSASFEHEEGRPWMDVDRGMLWPPARARITKKRNPPIPISDKLLTHLRAWKRQGFRYVVQWGEHSVVRVDRTVKEIAIDVGLGEDVTPHVLRHTATTWQMQAGTDLLEASRYLGMTVKTLETVYAHHRPEHLSDARDAHHRHRRQRPANNIHEQNAKPSDRRST